MAMFSQPSGGAWLKLADLNGHLILVTRVHSIEPRFDQFAGKDKDTARISIVDLDDPQWGNAPAEVLDSHPGVVNKLTDALRSGGMVLGRISQVATKSGNAAWVLGPYTEGVDDVRAEAWVNAHPASQFGQPAPAAAPQPVAPVAVPAPVQAPVVAAVPSLTAVPPAAPVAQAPAPAAAPAGMPAGVSPEVLALLQQLQGQQQS